MVFDGYSYDQLRQIIGEEYPGFAFGETIKSHTKKKIEFATQYVDQCA